MGGGAGGSLFWLRAATLQALGNLHSEKKSCPGVMKSQSSTLTRQSSHFVQGSKARRRGGDTSTQGFSQKTHPSPHHSTPTTSSSLFLYFLNHILRNYSDFFVLLFPSQGQMVLKTTKTTDQSQIKVLFSRSTVPKS